MRLLISLSLGLLLGLTLLFLVAESLGWMGAGSVSAWMEAAVAAPGGRALTAALVIGLLAGDLVLPVPSSIVMTLSGAFLGSAAGSAASFIGSMGSALIGFVLCRRLGRRAFERIVGAADTVRVAHFMQRYGAWGILLSRSVPMLTEIVSCMAGLSRLSARRFALLTAAGTLPLCVVYAWAGSRGDEAGIGWAVLLAFILPAIGLLAMRRLERPPAPRESP